MKRWLFALCLAAPASPFLALASEDGGGDPVDAHADAEPERVDREGSLRLARKALARIKEGAWAEAADLLRAAHDKNPKDAAIATDCGYALAHLGLNDEAERLYRQAIESDPHRFYAYTNLGALWTSHPDRWQRRDEMTSFLAGALVVFADDARAHAHIELQLAALERSLGRTAEARARLDRLAGNSAPPQVRRRAAQMRDELDAEARERALDDWPAPEVSAADQKTLAQLPHDGRALEALDKLVARWPAWREARWRRGVILEQAGQIDDAVADFTVVTQLSPSHAGAWRHLGSLLAVHGGRLEADRADQALRQALALEPSWSDLRDVRAKLASKRARNVGTSANHSADDPSPKARQLLQDAQGWLGMEAPEMARPLLLQALADSPGFVDAALAVFSLDHSVPDPTIKALWNDGAALWRLAAPILAQKTRESEMARAWLDRAVELGQQEARFARALQRAHAGDGAGAMQDLSNYVAAEPTPPRLEEARALRLTLGAPSVADSPERLARLHLVADRPDEARAALGGSCRAGLPFENLLALGRVYEYTGDGKAAVDCYVRALEQKGVPADRVQAAWDRLGAAASTLPARDLEPLQANLRAAAEAHVALAWLGLGRLAETRGAWPEARAAVQTYLAKAAPDDPRLESVRQLDAKIAAVLDRQAQESGERMRRIRMVVALIVMSVVAGLALRRLRRTSIARALRMQPLFFPALARAVGRVRHDVIKHRASALELLADPAANRDEIGRALREPTPASQEVADIYVQLAQEAKGLGLTLRELKSESVFGGLSRDLARAEELLARPDGDSRALRALDERVRGVHAQHLQKLLGMGPRTRLDPALLARWIEGVSGEPSAAPWVPPGLSLQAAGVVFPLNEQALRAVFSNLLRNAVAAVAGESKPILHVRVDESRDALGRRTVTLAVADSCPRSLRDEDIEASPPERGLGIVREGARRWGGQVVVRSEAAPCSKSVGVRFPAPPEVTP